MIFLSTLLAFAGDPIQDLAQSQKALQDRNYDRSSELLNHMLREHNGTPQAIEAKITGAQFCMI